MILTQLKQLTSIGRLGILVIFLMGCAQVFIGSLSGLVVQGNDSANVSINFSSVNFPSSGTDDIFIIRVSNISDDELVFTLFAKNVEAETLQSKFPIGTYNIDGVNNSATGSLLFIGTSQAQITGIGGFFNLTTLSTGVDGAGNAAIGIIAGEFSIDLEDGGFLEGTFEENFT